ncbi:MAG TPA: hypothetical protein PJ988_09645 [Anaerolinea sp.]|nr:hypothetical protein [Anaerolinea sp.]
MSQDPANSPVSRLYDLLPAIYRLRDEQTGGQLRALLEVIAEQADLVEEDIHQLYQDWFIETAAEWVVPYIGDLLGVQPLHAVGGDAGFSLRAYVANTLAYRRRKGTAYVLEDLARAVSGWPSRSAEFFQRLQTTQNLNHLSTRRTTVDLRQPDALDRLDGPFDGLAHSLDVRPTAQHTGWHAVQHIGLFVWRLKAYPLAGTAARRSSTHPYGFYFNPLGASAALFNQPQADSDLAHLAEEVNVPGPIRPMAAALDLSRYRLEQAHVAAEQRPANSDFYGPDRSLQIKVDGQALVPMQVTAWDLSGWDRPPAGVSGLFSGDLNAFPALGASPQVDASLDGTGPRTLTLAGPPTDLTACAAALEAALRAADPDPVFTRARVLVDGSRLLVLPGRTGGSVQFGPSAGDAATVTALKLDGGASTGMRGALSADLHWLPGPIDPNPRLTAQIGTAGPHLVTLISRPGSPEEARSLLEAGLRLAGPEPEFTQARVLRVEEHLLALPGVDGARVRFSAAPADRSSVELLGLADQVGLDVRLGRLAFPLDGEPAGEHPVRVNYSYGFSADLGGGPYTRPPDTQSERPDAARIAVRQGTPVDSLGKALQAWTDGGKKPTVIELLDPGPYEEALAIDLPASAWLRIQAGAGVWPHLRLTGTGQVSAAEEGAALILEGLLVEGGLELSGGLRLEARHTTFVPGQGVNEQGEAAFPERPSLSATGSHLARMSVTLDHAISGPVVLPEGIEQVQALDSIMHAPRSAAGDLQAALAGSLDGAQPGPPASLERVSVFGLVHVRQIDLASETIFNDGVVAERRQVGCVRFSYLPDGASQVPAPYRCQPGLALEERAVALMLNGPSALPAAERARILARVKPEFSAERYAHPAYAQLSLGCAAEIRTGGEQGGEMGAFNHLQQPMREANLRQALPDYLPFGMDLGFIFVT